MILTRTPFRLPIGGGGTDLPAYYQRHGGYLITAAINKYMFININKPAVADKIKINYSKVEMVDPEQIHTIQHDIVRESLKHLGIRIPIEISSMADLSAGTGMGSSSSYTVGLLRGLNALNRRFVSTHELAEEACAIEMQFIGKPIGKQDQYAAAFGGILEMEIDRMGRVLVTPLEMHPETVHELENRLMMFYTYIQRDANGILAEQSKKAKEDERKAVEAMHEIKRIGRAVKAALAEGDINRFGKLLHEHWLAKKGISNQMTNDMINVCYEAALQNGAIGGKIMGAGGGGFLLLCAEEGRRKHLRKVMEAEGLKFMDFRFDWDGSKVLVNF